MPYVTLSPTFYKRISISFLCLFIWAHVQGQYQYSKADQKQIAKNRKAGQAGFQNYDREVFYKTGLFFENLYRKYKDTSIQAAIRYYAASVMSEGDTEDASQKAALQLGKIYETGVGVPVDYNKAADYFLVSGEQGKTQLADMVKKICPADSVLYNPAATAAPADSVVLQFNPFCLLQSPATMNALSDVAAYAKANPQLQIHFAVAAPSTEFITSYHEYWKRTVAYKRICQQVTDLLSEQISLSHFHPSYRELVGQDPVFKLIIHFKEVQKE